ncbi:MAG: hypothetical protein ACTTJ9_05145, partial [Segatella oris]|uniref:hypothetical protein n=1 Tax=Segatella oris TaxID=28135 RepID=UPI003FA1D292
MAQIYNFLPRMANIEAIKVDLGTVASRYFFSDYFAVSKFCYTFVAVNELATPYQHNISMQGILKFFASFCADYLV